MNVQTDILLVEDDVDAASIALRALAKVGLETSVKLARDGLEALEMLGIEPDRPNATLPSVVFLDLKMPRVDGWEVLRRMRANPATRSIPAVVTSSSNRSEDIERSYRLGANSFLVKGFDSLEPGSYIAIAAQYWIHWNHTAERRTKA